MANVTDLGGHIDRKTRSPDRGIGELADRQHGAVAHWQLLTLGVSTEAIRGRVRRGRLHQIHRGVYTVGRRGLSANGHVMAAALAYGDGALVSHRTAAWLWGLLDDSRRVTDVIAVAKRRSRPGICFHGVRHLHVDDRAESDGIPVTSVARTLLDIAPVIPLRRLVYALEQAEKQRLFDMAEIEAVMARCEGHRGTKPLQQALKTIEPEAQHAHKGLERAFIAFCKDYELQMPAMNAVVEGFTVDALWTKQKLIVELDSWEHHKDRRAFEEDRRRDLILTAAGYRILRITQRRLHSQPAQLAALISGSRPSLAATA